MRTTETSHAAEQRNVDAAEPAGEPVLAGAWPEGKRFAFTVVDDTEASTVENVGGIYEHLLSRGIPTTKTVWPLGFREPPLLGGGTLDDDDYREWVQSLAAAGCEIALHGATDGSSTREFTLRALDRFRDIFGHDPRMHVNHFGQAEALYWGEDRLGGVPRLAYKAVNRALRRKTRYYGHVEESPYFWGDLARDRIEYVRDLTFARVNTLEADPLMPYHDPRRPYVNYWFSSSEAPTFETFCDLLSEESQDRLVEEGGACIVYTHFAFGFTEGGQPKPEFARLVDRLAQLPGWFVPASQLLDHLRVRPGWRREPGPAALGRVQRRWLRAKLVHGRL